MRFSSLSTVLVASLAFAGCSSSATETPPPADSGTDTPNDVVVVPDVKKDGDAIITPVDTGPTVDISGSFDISLRVVTALYLVKSPVDGVAIRVENKDGTGYLEGKTGADGVGHLKVDPAKGPYDVTIAKAGMGVVSILNIAPSGSSLALGDIVTYDLGAAAFKTATIGGTLTGVGSGNSVQIDAWNYTTAVAKPGATTWSSKYAYQDITKDPPIPMAAIEADSTGKVVNGVITPSAARTGSAMTVNIAMPSPAVAPTLATINVKFPATGVLTGAKLTKVANPVGDVHLGNSIVVRSMDFAEMFVGVADATVPASNASTLKLQTFGGDLKPDSVQAAWSGGNLYARADITDLTDGSTQTFGDVKTLDISGADLSDFTFAAEGTGYEFASAELIDSASNSVVWNCWVQGGKIASRRLPHLPTSVKLDDIVAGFSGPGVVVLEHLSSTSPWSDLRSGAKARLVVSNTSDTLDGAGR